MEKGFIVTLVFAIIVGVFCLANNDIVTVDFIFKTVHMSQAIVILISVLLGAIIVFTFTIYKNFRFKQSIRNLNKEISQLKSEIDLMKNLDRVKEEKRKEMETSNEIENLHPDHENLDEEIEELEENNTEDKI